jgi:predicted O-linked N-acetylglucosamine transferase (SPINDLY family)
MTIFSNNTAHISNTPQSHNDKGLAFAARGQIDNAINAFKQAVYLDPDYAEAHFNLGLANTTLGNFEAAIENYNQCLRLNPDHTETRYNLANALLKKNDINAAIQAYKKVIRLDPHHAQAFNNLGLALKISAKTSEAIQNFKQAIELKPDFAEAYNNLGMAYRLKGDKAGAGAQFQKALELNENYAPAYFNLGTLYLDVDKPTEAIASYRRYLQLHPDNAAALNNLGNVCYRQGQVTEAVSCYKRSLRHNPDCAQTYYNLANALQDTDEAAEAVWLYQKALKLNPNWPEAYNNLGTVYQNLGMLSEAIAGFQKALDMRPDYAEAFNNLGIVYRNQGRIKEAISCYRAALQNKPQYSECHSNLVFGLNYDPNVDQKDIFTQACQWWTQHGLPAADKFVHDNTRDPNRRLKIGYVSADFRRHPVGFFFLPLVNAHDHDGFEVFCYTDIKQPDELTDQIKTAADHWCSTLGLSDADMAEKIHADQIDILIDLAGHTANNRLLVFARKPVPLQVNWLGYVNTTGMPVMDYRISDRIVDPEPDGSSFHSETIIRLENGFFCFAPPQNSPPVGDLPARKLGHITFGCFNNLTKINKDVIALWSQIMHRLPGSHLRLMAKPLADPSTRDRYLTLFQTNDISSDRIEMLTYTPSYYDYLKQYTQIDIGLDTYPHNGHTTTCDSLWMGIPVITLRGDRYASRMGASVLTRLKLQGFVAETEEAYLQKAVNLAADLDRLQELRLGMRKRVTSSPIYDSKRFANEMESALREIWRVWCQGRG